MPKKKKPRIEFRYYKMPLGSSILALLGKKWIKEYGRDIDYLHFHNYLELGYCYSGEGFLVLGEEQHRYAEGYFTVIPPNYPHTTNSDPGTLSQWEYLFVDAEAVMQEFYQNTGKMKQAEQVIERVNSQAFVLAEQEGTQIAGLMRGIMDLMRESGEFCAEECKGLMTALLHHIARKNDGVRRTEHTEDEEKATILISRALGYISLHYAQQLRIEDLAAWCHISETHFRRAFTEYMSMGPLEYINLVRIQNACYYLKKTDEPVADIAAKCGFTTLSTFNRNFRRVTGATPREWRNRPENYEQQILKYNIALEEGW